VNDGWGDGFDAGFDAGSGMRDYAAVLYWLLMVLFGAAGGLLLTALVR
jgi:hypothetical protein